MEREQQTSKHVLKIVADVARRGSPQNASLNVGDRQYALTIVPVTEINSVATYAQDATARNRAQTRLKKEAFHDTLTRLPNRALLIDPVARA